MKKLPILFFLLVLNQFFAQAQDVIKVGDNALNCLEDPDCINRLHPEISMTSFAKPGDTIYFNSRNCDDFDLDPDAPKDPRIGDPQWGTVHPLAGPVYIEGAEAGDVLKVTIQKVIPGKWTFTLTDGGLAIGDVHYIQGDGEVSGTALEMDATVIVTTEVLKDGPKLSRGPHYEGPSSLLNIPSERFYATTGLPLKDREEVPSDLAYLASKKIPQLENLSKDISLAAKNALLEMIDYISLTYGYTREEAYLIASVAVDLRIGQLVDAPNVGVTAILPLDIFVKD